MPVPKRTSPQTQELSIYLIISLVFVAHGLVNAALLSPWNSLRCTFWKTGSCTPDQEWILNFRALSHFHVMVLVSALIYSARGKLLLEQRLAFLVAALSLVYLATGVFQLDQLFQPMALMQAMIYLAFLFLIAHTVATAPPVVPFPSDLKASSFDKRKKLALPTLIIIIHFGFAILQVYAYTFGNGRDAYLGATNTQVYQDISNAASCDMMLAAILLGLSVLLSTVEQQQTLLVAQALVMFVTLAMLAGSQGEVIESKQLRAGAAGAFAQFLLALVGTY